MRLSLRRARSFEFKNPRDEKLPVTVECASVFSLISVAARACSLLRIRDCQRILVEYRQLREVEM